MNGRVSDLEERAGEGPDVIGVRWPGGLVQAGGREMDEPEFWKRYPDGDLIVVVYGDPRAADRPPPADGML